MEYKIGLKLMQLLDMYDGRMEFHSESEAANVALSLKEAFGEPEEVKLLTLRESTSAHAKGEHFIKYEYVNGQYGEGRTVVKVFSQLFFSKQEAIDSVPEEFRELIRE